MTPDEYQGVHPGSGAPRDTSYNGWTNRSTWAVALWLDNDEPLYRLMQTFARAGDVTAESTRAWFVETIQPTGTITDQISLSLVNWQEIVDDCVMESIVGEAEDEGPAPDLNPEGDPTLNGAFGV